MSMPRKPKVSALIVHEGDIDMLHLTVETTLKNGSVDFKRAVPSGHGLTGKALGRDVTDRVSKRIAVLDRSLSAGFVQTVNDGDQEACEDYASKVIPIVAPVVDAVVDEFVK